MENNNEALVAENIKIAFYGDSGVGKTALSKRWGTDAFHETYQTTLGVDFENKIICNAELGLELDLQIWDIDGQKQFESMLPFYFQETHWVILVFSVTDRRSFEHLDHYFAIARNTAPHAHYVILGNKIDLEAERQVNSAEAQAFSKTKKAIYIETSAKKGLGLHKLEKKILALAANPTLEMAGVKAPDPALSIFGGQCKPVSLRPKTIAVLNPTLANQPEIKPGF